jgi:hypothetical protein
VAGAVYLRTLAPGLVADLDTPMFQFVGRVLGVAHNPGYPLFVFLTFPFSYLPFGSLAYRINLFSAICGLAAVCLACLAARRMHCRALIAIGAALGLAFGKVFWSQSVIAEVYTLNAAIVAGLLFALLEWRRTGRPGWFWCGVALFSAGLGNHITIVGFAPAAAAFALLTDARFVRRSRTLLITSAITAAGLFQYAFVLVRSHHPTAYVESRATTLATLFDVVRARQFSDQLFAFDARTVVVERVPLLVGRVLQPELGVTALLVALVGTIWLLFRRRAEGWFLMLGFAAIFGFTLNYDVVDSPVFLIPAILLLWLAAAVGGEQLATWLEGQTRFSGTLAAVAMLALPAANLRANFAGNDLSRAADADVHFERLFAGLPPKTTLVREDFVVDRMLMYHLAGAGSARGRQIELAPPDPSDLSRRLREGFSVFAFEKGIRRLRPEGLSFSDRPERLIDGPLGGFLERLPRGSLVAIAVPIRHQPSFAASGTSFKAIGGRDADRRQGASHEIVVGVVGARGAIERRSHDDLAVSLGAGERIGASGHMSPAAIEVLTHGERAAIRLSSRDIVATSEGAAVAVWDPEGRLNRTFVLQPGDGFGVPVRTSPLSVYRLRGLWTQQHVTAGDWTDLADIAATGSLMAHVPAGAALVLYLQDDEPLAPWISDWSSNAQKVDLASFERIGDEARSVLSQDHVDPARFDRSQRLHRIQMHAPASGPGRISVELALGGIPTRAIGRLTSGGGTGRAASLFRVDTIDQLREIDDRTSALLMGRDSQQPLVGAGWAQVEVDAAGPYRWMTATRARLLLPVPRNAGRELQLQAFADEEGPTNLAIRLNGVALPPQAARRGWAWYGWKPPSGTIRPGTNELTLLVDRLSPPKGAVAPRALAVSDVRVTFGQRSE